MKKMFTFLSLMLLSGLVSAQVTVNYMVDVTDYLAAGNELNENGIRIGGNFGDFMAEDGDGDMIASWTPSDENSAMTDMGDNIWSISVTYPESAVGSEQLFKFVNGDWGTNEGTDGSLIAENGCGVDDGGGNINRTQVVPTEDLTLKFCWDACTQCDGSSAIVEEPAEEMIAVLLKVDVTDYLAAGNELAEGGIRLGGNFGDTGATLPDGTPVAQWTPSDPSAMMMDEGDNVYSIQLMYPESSIGLEQLFKFVNGDWGTNEGLEGSLIAENGCGVDDGAGNINRTLVIPSETLMLMYCWDLCSQCDGSDANITSVEQIEAVSAFGVGPNPVNDYARFDYELTTTGRVSIAIYNLMGQRVAQVLDEVQTPGSHTARFDASNLSAGSYLYRVRVDGQADGGLFIKL